MCEEYRQELMAYADGEVTDRKQRADIEAHMVICSACYDEYRDYRALGAVCRTSLNDSPPSKELSGYYTGVCRKLERRVSFYAWNAGALLLLISGSIMTFNDSSNLMTEFLGVVSMIMGAAFIWLGYFCNDCKSNKTSKMNHQNQDEFDELFK